MIMCIDSGIRLMKSQNVSCAVAFWGMHEVGELQRVLDEEHRDVVADEIEVAFLRVELRREAAHVARQIDGARAAGDRREPDEHRRLDLGVGQERRL